MKKELRIDGMNCGKCASHVEHALLDVANVLTASVDLTNKTATISFEQDVATQALVESITEAGYGFVSISEAIA
ncbi:MAG: heavy-metal-associated domain-containing protein [Erysipelotrichaceae bacterium]